MKYFSFFLYTIMFIAILTPVAVVIFGFFDIKVAVYGNYLFWFIAMALFNALLPFDTKNIFLEIDPTDALPTTDGKIGEPIVSKFLSVRKNDIIQGTGTGQWYDGDKSSNKNPATYKKTESKIWKEVKRIPIFPRILPGSHIGNTLGKIVGSSMR